MIVTVDWIEQNYIKFNKRLYDGVLPQIKFNINNAKKFWGFASFKYDWANNTIIPEAITISNYYDSPENVKIQTLLHEMIHIADYTFHPEHFIKNRRRVSGKTYNPHGMWFMSEAKRISEKTGFSVTNFVTQDEMNISTLSEKSKLNEEKNRNNALICAITGNKSIWYFKTDIHKVDYLKNNLQKMYNWDDIIGDIKTIKFYKFDNPSLASYRSCCKKIFGWNVNKLEFMNMLKKIKATEVHI